MHATNLFDQSKKYFEGGYYNKTLKGWIFRTQDKNKFLDKDNNVLYNNACLCLKLKIIIN